MNAANLLIEYAQRIAEYCGYETDEVGLQDMAILQSKLEAEEGEFAEASVSGDLFHMLHEAADCLYYSACISARMYARKLKGEHVPTPFYSYDIALHHVQKDMWRKGHHLTKTQIENAAIVKYRWRSSGPNNKDEAYELSLIQEVLEVNTVVTLKEQED